MQSNLGQGELGDDVGVNSVGRIIWEKVTLKEWEKAKKALKSDEAEKNEDSVFLFIYWYITNVHY